MSRIKLRDARRDLAGLPEPTPEVTEKSVSDQISDELIERQVRATERRDQAREAFREGLRQYANRPYHTGGLVSPNDPSIRLDRDLGRFARSLPASFTLELDPAEPGTDRTVTTTVLNGTVLDWENVSPEDRETLLTRRAVNPQSLLSLDTSSAMDSFNELARAFHRMGNAAAGTVTGRTASQTESERESGRSATYLRNERARILAANILDMSDIALRAEMGHSGPYPMHHTLAPGLDRLAGHFRNSPYLEAIERCYSVLYWGRDRNRVIMTELLMRDGTKNFMRFLINLGGHIDAHVVECSCTQEYNELVGESIHLAGRGRVR